MALETETGFENETETEKKIAAHISALVELLPHWDTMVYVPMTDEQANLLAENISGDGVIKGAGSTRKSWRR
jgi:hypothetical protein